VYEYIRTLTAAWLDAFQRSRGGGQLNKSTREINVKCLYKLTLKLLVCVNLCFHVTYRQIKHQYDSTVTQLNAEIGQLQEELCKSQGACNAANIQVQELRTALDNVRDQLFKQVRDMLFLTMFTI